MDIVPTHSESKLQELRDRDQWVAWKYTGRVQGGEVKATKVPLDPNTGRSASCTDPATWGSYEQASQLAAPLIEARKGGVGFQVTADDPYVVLDLDHCITGTEMHPAAAELISSLSSYWETSPSGTGVRIITRGEWPADAGHKITDTAWGGALEVYDEKRFVTITEFNAHRAIEQRTTELQDLSARFARDTATTVDWTGEADREEVDAIVEGMQGEPFWSRPGPNDDWSRLDIALCCRIAEIEPDPKLIEAVWAESPLADREKFERDGYRIPTIEHAIAMVTATPLPEIAAPAAVAPRSRIITWGELREQPEPECEPSWYENGLLPTAGSLILHGWVKSFKTFIALDLAAALTQCRPWCLFEPMEEPCRVAVLQYEITPAYYVQRLKQIEANAAEPQLFRENYLAIDAHKRPDFRAGDTKQEDELVKLLLDARADVFVLDPVRRAVGVADLNSEKEVRPLLNFFGRLQGEGITVITTHHDNKTFSRGGGGDPLGMTGAGAFAGDFDTIASISLPRGLPVDNPQRNLSFTIRNGPPISSRGMSMRDDGIEYSLSPHGCDEDGNEVRALSSADTMNEVARDVFKDVEPIQRTKDLVKLVASKTSLAQKTVENNLPKASAYRKLDRGRWTIDPDYPHV